MKELATVTKRKDKFAEVRIGRNSACASCGKCGMTENQKHVDFYTENTLDAQVGDVVEVEIRDSSTWQLAFVGYILPIIPALALLFVAISLWTEWLGIPLFFVGYALGFCIVALIDKAKKHKWMQSPSMLRIVTKSQIQENINDKKE